MAISNYLVSPTLEIPVDFPTGCVLSKLLTNPLNEPFTKPLATCYEIR